MPALHTHVQVTNFDDFRSRYQSKNPNLISEIQKCEPLGEDDYFCSCPAISFVGFDNGQFQNKTIKMIAQDGDCQPLDKGSDKLFSYSGVGNTTD